ncbi:unnamed protein product [Closterium sp. NIES-64]|nr:unnamed protein product [Closterium sp. NIES-65]CAI5991069.1 unnamed protein product [Closterium sp. NIES-64]
MAVPSQRTLRVVCILLLIVLPCLVEAKRKKKKGDTPPLPSVRFYKSTVKVSYAGVAKITATAAQGAGVQSRQVLETPRSQLGSRRLLQDDSIVIDTSATDPSAEPAEDEGQPDLDFDPRPLLPPADLTGATADLAAAKKRKPKTFLSLTAASFSPSVLKSGVSAYQTASTGTAAYAGTHGDSTVPDPSVCAGSNYVVQVVNWAIVVFDGRGQALTAPVALNEFLGVNPYRGSGTVGDLVTKASCVYDSATKRFFLSAAWLAGNSNAYDKFGQTRKDNKGVSRGSGIVLAVSAAEKPLDAWSVYFVGTTNDGTNGPDDHLAPLAYSGELFYNTYPRLGVDANGVYVTTQQATYSNVDDVWQGSNIFAFSKAALLKQADITAVRFALPRMSRTDQTVLQYWTIEPAASPADGKYDLTNKGTMWFGAYDVSWAMSGHSAVFAFALTNTVSLSANNPTLTLLTAIANCSFYYDWSSSQQKPGLAPLAESYNKDTPLIVPPRSTSVALSTGFLWMVVPTGTTISPNSEAGFMLVKMKATVAKGPSPALTLAVASAMIYNVPMNNLIAPTIAFNKLGKGIILATLVSPNSYPTVGFVRVTKAGINPKDLKFYTVVQSSAPLDVDSPSYSTKSTDAVAFVRYGTTQALAVDATGTVWAAGQYATEERTTRNNWATSLFSVTP